MLAPDHRTPEKLYVWHDVFTSARRMALQSAIWPCPNGGSHMLGMNAGVRIPANMALMSLQCLRGGCGARHLPTYAQPTEEERVHAFQRVCLKFPDSNTGRHAPPTAVNPALPTLAAAPPASPSLFMTPPPSALLYTFATPPPPTPPPTPSSASTTPPPATPPPPYSPASPTTSDDAVASTAPLPDIEMALINQQAMNMEGLEDAALRHGISLAELYENFSDEDATHYRISSAAVSKLARKAEHALRARIATRTMSRSPIAEYVRRGPAFAPFAMRPVSRRCVRASAYKVTIAKGHFVSNGTSRDVTAFKLIGNNVLEEVDKDALEDGDEAMIIEARN